MLKTIRRMAEPVVRLTSASKVDHRQTFEAFAAGLARRLEGERAEPRIVCIVERLMR
jgi:hypothetical protein